MRPFFPYHGSKWRLAKQYGPPGHDTVIEPFAGSAGYSTYWNSSHTVLIEKNPIIAGIWKWLIGASVDEIMELPAEITSLDDAGSIPDGARSFIGMWFSRGSRGPRPNIAKANLKKKQNGSGSVWGEKVKERTVRQIEGIRNWEVIEGDYSDAPDIEAHWHIDPPYQHLGGDYKFSGRGLDFQHLGEWCRSRKGSGEVCEAEGADWLPFEVLCKANSQTNNDYSEVVWWLNNSKGNSLLHDPSDGATIISE